MSHATKRLALTAKRLPTIPVSQLKAFPPKEAVAPKPSSSKTAPTPTFFDTEAWAALQSPNPAALNAFAHRIGLGKAFSSPVESVQQAVTHPSFLPLHAKHRPEEPVPATNGNLAALGNSLLGLFATEHVNATFPHLPTRVLKAAVSAYVGPTTCASIAQEMGVSPLLRWNRTPNTPTHPAVLHSDVLSSVPRALTALVYQHSSLHAARRFAQKFFLSRDVDLRSMIKFRDPKLALKITVEKFGRERPVSRLLKETGRLSISPVFVVGIYSGADQLGEGFGSSLRMAEYRAAEDALLRLYLTRQPPHLVQLPTSTFPDALGSVFDAHGPIPEYTPVEMTDTEVKFGSADRSGVHRAREIQEEED
ncbi:60S ribosomal protein L3 [Irpex rosettiformis]|uniref:60S ribosomal protein L3 n=1 Tax=Irpex rosettiformis TaxID=378272 RepID=A0ACB8UCK4_9APHY|nr:60S ribosomal protein L3 [Irpex rosettiformis]